MAGMRSDHIFCQGYMFRKDKCIAANMGTARIYVVFVTGFFLETRWCTFACGRVCAHFSNLSGMPEVSL